MLVVWGETTVKVTGAGIGGPNAHFALALLDALDGARGISAIVCDTDGVDGAAEIAGACIDDETLENREWLGSIIEMPFAAKMRTLSFNLWIVRWFLVRLGQMSTTLERF